MRRVKRITRLVMLSLFILTVIVGLQAYWIIIQHNQLVEHQQSLSRLSSEMTKVVDNQKIMSMVLKSQTAAIVSLESGEEWNYGK